MTPALARTLNALGLLAVSAILLLAFLDQLLLADLPCPLCLLQRAGFAAVGIGLALNLRFGPRPSHYALVILAAMVGAATSLRQVLLHVVPGTGAYGGAVFGLHLYSWAFLLFMLIVLGSAVMLLFDRQFAPDERAGGRLSTLATLAFALALLLALGNGISTLLECGVGLCPDDPVSYQLLK